MGVWNWGKFTVSVDETGNKLKEETMKVVIIEVKEEYREVAALFNAIKLPGIILIFVPKGAEVRVADTFEV